MKTRTGIAILVLVVALALTLGIVTWKAMGAVDISIVGWLAVVVGTLATAGLGGGLMALVFYSARKGYDDDVGH